MAKGKKATRREGSSDDVAAEPSAEPVLALKLDSRSSEPVELAGDGGFQPPCTFTGLGAGFSGGMLGWVFGFGERGCAVLAWASCAAFEPAPVCAFGRTQQACGSFLSATAAAPALRRSRPPPAGGYWMRQRLKGQWKASLAEGWASAKVWQSLLWHCPCLRACNCWVEASCRQCGTARNVIPPSGLAELPLNQSRSCRITWNLPADVCDHGRAVRRGQLPRQAHPPARGWCAALSPSCLCASCCASGKHSCRRSHWIAQLQLKRGQQAYKCPSPQPSYKRIGYFCCAGWNGAAAGCATGLALGWAGEATSGTTRTAFTCASFCYVKRAQHCLWVG